MRVLLPSLLLVVAAALAAGCATPGDVERLEARIVDLERHRAQLRESMEQDFQRLEKLHAMVTESEEELRKNGANLGLRLQRVETEVPKQKGTLESLQVRMARIEADIQVIKTELADRLGSTAFFLPPDLPKDKDGMWAAGEAAASRGEVRETQAIFELYEASFPDDVRAPHALWQIAQTMEKSGDTDEAIRFYQKVFDRYRDSEIAPQAVMRIAEIYVIKNDCGRAKSIYKFVADEFRGTAIGDDAKKRQRNVLKECKKGS